MKKISIAIVSVFLAFNVLACCCSIPNVNVNLGPTVEVGPLREKEESVPLEDVDLVEVDLLFAVGELEIAAGAGDQLLAGTFRYNVEELEPTVSYKDGDLSIEQGDDDEAWKWPGDEIRNEWTLAFSPDVPLKIDLKAGAGAGELDLTGLQIETLDVDIGAGSFDLRFDEPNPIEMKRFTLDAGAARLDVSGIGNASPEDMVVQGGAGEIEIDLTGDWVRSADIKVTAGVGDLTLRLPEDVGARVDVEGGLSSVNATGLERSGGDYVNDAYGESEIELDIRVTTGIGQVTLEVAD